MRVAIFGLAANNVHFKATGVDGGMQLVRFDLKSLVGLLQNLDKRQIPLLQARKKNASKVQVDIEHWREMRDDSLAHRVRQIAEIVRQTGRPYHLEPMNAYERRIVHNAFKDDPEVMTWSPPDDARVKRITLKRRPPSPPSP